MQKFGEILKKDDRDVILDGADIVSQQGYTLIPNYVLKTDAIGVYAKIVYTMLLSFAWGDKDESFPGQAKLATQCGISERSVRDAIKELETKKFITIRRRGLGKTNQYILHFKRR